MSTTILIFCIWFQVLNAYGFLRSNSWENDKRWKSETKWKRLVSSYTFREKSLKLVYTKKDLFWKPPQANPNPNPKLNRRVRVGVNSWENDKRWESETKWKRLVSSQMFREKSLKLVYTKKYLFWKSPQAKPNPNPKLNPRVRVGVNSWKNDKRSEPESKCKRSVSS